MYRYMYIEERLLVEDDSGQHSLDLGMIDSTLRGEVM